MSTNKLINNLKSDGEDFEFYPTTDIMLDAIIADMENSIYVDKPVTVLDIGAGDCRLYHKLQQAGEKYPERGTFHTVTYRFGAYKVIEKAMQHIRNLANLPKATLVGTEFFDCDLSSIPSNISFVNPPYSQYEQWMTQIISTVTSPVIYAVIPQRWANNQNIKNALKHRDMTAQVIYSGDFLEADRKARAVVDIVRIVQNTLMVEDFHRQFRDYGSAIIHLESSFSAPDPLLAYFDQFEAVDDNYSAKLQEQEAEQESLELTFKENRLDGLVDSYTKARLQLQEDLLNLQKVSPHLLKMFKIDGKIIVEKIRSDLASLKNRYWQTFFSCYEPITSRLTKASRENLQRTLQGFADLDFTHSNCLAVAMLSIDRANRYFDKQIKQLFYKHADKDNLACYKSNQRVLGEDNRYRYNRYSMSYAEKEVYFEKTKLEYRLVVSYYVVENMFKSNWGVPVYRDIINDYVVVARTLGFDIPSYHLVGDLDFGKNIKVYNSKNNELLFDIKFYKKGTYHVRLNQDLCLRLNVAIGKIFNWIHKPGDIRTEIDENADESLWQAIDYLGEQTLKIGSVV